MANLKLFEKYTPLVYKIINKFTIPESHKEDITQECFMRLWKCCNNYNEELGAQFITYAYISIENTILTNLRKLKKYNYLNLKDINIKQDHGYSEIEISDLLDKLPKDDCSIFKQYFYEKLTNTEIAKKLGVSNQAISNRLYKIKEKLARHYENKNFGMRAHIST